MHIVVWFQEFLSNTNNLHTVVWLQVFLSNTNNMHTVVWSQVFLSNTNNIHIVVWFKVFLSNTNNMHRVLWFQVFLSNTNNLHIIIMSCRQHGYPWPSLATALYRSSLLASPQGYIPYPHRAPVCRFELVVLLLLGHVRGSIGVHHLWARLCFVQLG